MKYHILSLCTFILLSTSCQEPNTELDAILLECYDANYQEAGYDIKSIIDAYEGALVREGILKDDSGRSYLEVVQKITSDRAFRIEAPAFQQYDPLLKVATETRMAVFECEQEMTEALKQEDSKWKSLDSILKSPKLQENPHLMYQRCSEVLSEQDLNSYYFKLKMFQLFDAANTQWETGR